MLETMQSLKSRTSDGSAWTRVLRVPQLHSRLSQIARTGSGAVWDLARGCPPTSVGWDSRGWPVGQQEAKVPGSGSGLRLGSKRGAASA